MSRNHVAVLDRQRKYGLDRHALAAAADKVLGLCGEERQELSIVLLSDRAIRKVNRDFRGEDAATDVISFAMREGKGGDASGRLLGDLLISLETLVRQAAVPHDDGRPGTGTPKRELALMTIHGILHLLGHDHVGGAKKADAMRALEAELFEKCWRRFPDVRRRFVGAP
jgi:probable rRNA maturation factor